MLVVERDIRWYTAGTNLVPIGAYIDRRRVSTNTGPVDIDTGLVCID
jgi:hypothetical protein